MAEEIKENCPFAYRQYGDKNVHCRKIQEIPYVRWTFCAHQYECRRSGRWEATKNPKDCKYRQGASG